MVADDIYFTKVREQRRPVPAFSTQFLPAIIIRNGSSVKDHLVQYRPATDYFPLRYSYHTIAQLGLGNIAQVPVVFGSRCTAVYSSIEGNGDIIFSLVAADSCQPFELSNIQRKYLTALLLR